MKNIIYLLPSEINDHIKKKWKTDFFKAKQEENNSLIGYVVTEASKLPLAFYDFSDIQREKRHMTPWFNMIANREYDDPYLHDMYLFHELYHLSTLPLNLFDNFEEWKSAMWLNELYASLTTEVFIYHWYPELREKTFQEEIWFDLLKEKWGLIDKTLLTKEVALCHTLPSVFGKIEERRLDIRNGRPAENKPEEWFVRYNNYNNWFAPWKINFVAMQGIRQSLIKNGNWKEAWGILAKEMSNPSSPIPFVDSVKSYNY